MACSLPSPSNTIAPPSPPPFNRTRVFCLDLMPSPSILYVCWITRPRRRAEPPECQGALVSTSTHTPRPPVFSRLGPPLPTHAYLIAAARKPDRPSDGRSAAQPAGSCSVAPPRNTQQNVEAQSSLQSAPAPQEQVDSRALRLARPSRRQTFSSCCESCCLQKVRGLCVCERDAQPYTVFNQENTHTAKVPMSIRFECGGRKLVASIQEVPLGCQPGDFKASSSSASVGSFSVDLL